MQAFYPAEGSLEVDVGDWLVSSEFVFITEEGAMSCSYSYQLAGRFVHGWLVLRLLYVFCVWLCASTCYVCNNYIMYMYIVDCFEY